MPFATRDGVRLYWKLDGAADQPPLVLLNSIGTDMALWDATLPHLLPRFQLLRLDTRGHGASDAPVGDYDMSSLASDVAAAMDSAGIKTAAIAGVSLGGMIAMQLAIDHPTRVSALALICTSAEMDPASWAARVQIVRANGTGAIAEMAVGRFLSVPYAAQHPEIADGLKRAITAQSDAGYAGAGAAIRDMRLADRVGTIAVPVLVVTGDVDVSTPFEGHGDNLLEALPDARHVALASAHLPPIEAPAELAAALQGFLLPDTQKDDAADTLFGNRPVEVACRDWN